MAWFILSQLFSTLIQLIRLGRKSDHEKELEIMILRFQLAIVDRKLQSPLRPSRAEKLTLAVLLARLKQGTRQPAHQLQDIIRIFQPETVLRWHRDLVRRKWTYPQQHRSGRPPISPEIEDLIIRFAQENASWGYGKIEGELLKLGFRVSQSTIRNVVLFGDFGTRGPIKIIVRMAMRCFAAL